MILYVLPILAAIAVLTAATGIYQMIRGEDRVGDRLRQIRGVTLASGETLEEALGGGPLPWMLRPLKLLSCALPGFASSAVLRWELAGAGFRHVDAGHVFTGFRVLATVCLTLSAMTIAEYFGMLRNEVLLITLIAGLLGFMLPWMLLRLAQNSRREEITLALPDALDLMVICVEAGQGLNAALMSVSRESSMHSPAPSAELRILNLEMSTGVQRSQALRNLALRTGIDDMRALVAVLVQSDKFGTSVGQALRTHAQSLRIRRRQRAEEAARKTPVKMVFPLVFCIFPALLVVILAPGIIELVRALQDVNS
jgi:tight adherence protein C